MKNYNLFEVKKSHTITHFIFALLAVFIAGCGGGGGDAEKYGNSGGDLPEPGPVGQGRFVDSEVSNLDYVSGVMKGSTDKDGTFVYELGQITNFYIGDLHLGGILLDESDKDIVITPLDLANADHMNEYVMHILQILITCDSDDDPYADGINIDDACKDKLTGAEKVDIKDPEFEVEVQKYLGEQILKSDQNAKMHFSTTLGESIEKELHQINLDHIDSSSVTSNFSLPVEVDDFRVEWTTDDKSIIEIKDAIALVNRPDTDQSAKLVKLTAEVFYRKTDVSRSKDFLLTVLPKPDYPNSLRITHNPDGVIAGEKLELQAEVISRLEKLWDAKGSLSWKISQTNLASISDAGVLTTFFDGEVQVEAVYEESGYSAVIEKKTINIKPPEITGLAILNSNNQVISEKEIFSNGDTVELKAALRFSNGNIGDNVITRWIVENEDIATVDDSGKVTSKNILNTQSTTLTASYLDQNKESLTADITLTVKAEPILGVFINNKEAEGNILLPENGKEQSLAIKVKYHPNDNFNEISDWSTLNFPENSAIIIDSESKSIRYKSDGDFGDNTLIHGKSSKIDISFSVKEFPAIQLSKVAEITPVPVKLILTAEEVTESSGNSMEEITINEGVQKTFYVYLQYTNMQINSDLIQLNEANTFLDITTDNEEFEFSGHNFLNTDVPQNKKVKLTAKYKDVVNGIDLNDTFTVNINALPIGLRVSAQDENTVNGINYFKENTNTNLKYSLIYSEESSDFDVIVEDLDKISLQLLKDLKSVDESLSDIGIVEVEENKILKFKGIQKDSPFKLQVKYNDGTHEFKTDYRVTSVALPTGFALRYVLNYSSQEYLVDKIIPHSQEETSKNINSGKVTYKVFQRFSDSDEIHDEYDKEIAKEDIPVDLLSIRSAFDFLRESMECTGIVDVPGELSLTDSDCGKSIAFSNINLDMKYTYNDIRVNYVKEFNGVLKLNVIN